MLEKLWEEIVCFFKGNRYKARIRIQDCDDSMNVYFRAWNDMDAIEEGGNLGWRITSKDHYLSIFAISVKDNGDDELKMIYPTGDVQT